MCVMYVMCNCDADAMDIYYVVRIIQFHAFQKIHITFDHVHVCDVIKNISEEFDRIFYRQQLLLIHASIIFMTIQRSMKKIVENRLLFLITEP